MSYDMIHARAQVDICHTFYTGRPFDRKLPAILPGAVRQGYNKDGISGRNRLPGDKRMTRSIGHLFSRAAVVLAAAVLVIAVPVAAQTGEKISAPGRYSGYSSPIYTDVVRISQYIPTRDGTRLAADIFRPAENGVPVDDPLPVIWTLHRYHRATPLGDQLNTILDVAPELRDLIRHGYVVAAVDTRGSGASFGTAQGVFTPEEARDAYDVTEWFAAQPWCSGAVGMYGLSYLGITQYLAASAQPPHLKALFPMMAMFDMYSFIYPGGVLAENFVLRWGANTFLLDRIVPAAPVDDDPDGALLRRAIAEHRANANVYALAQQFPFRDSTAPDGVTQFHIAWSPATWRDAINASGVAIYHLGGWYDMYPRDTLLWYANLSVPQRIIITPWSHNGRGQFDLGAEHLRWFDYWLKGIDNGIMDEPPIVYYVMGAPRATAWRTAGQWPLPQQQLTPFYFAAADSAAGESLNDGRLAFEPQESGADTYTPDYSTTTGTTNRWTDGYGGGFGYADMRPQDARSITYTTPPLETDVEITGHPVVHLWVSVDAEDSDFFVYLEEVMPDGRSHYITEGVLRASHRALHTPPFDNFGLPYHRSYAADVEPLTPGEPVELVFDLHPTSNIFDAGHRIRVRVSNADAGNFAALVLDPPPSITIHRDAAHPSRIVLPVIPPQ